VVYRALCDRTTSRMRGLSPKIISGDSRRSENTQTQHIEAYNTIYEVQVKVITYLVPCIKFTKDEAQKIASRDISKFWWKYSSLTISTHCSP
jgi:hypothetical protein